jgi:hypothetical protein
MGINDYATSIAQGLFSPLHNGENAKELITNMKAGNISLGVTMISK